MTATAKDSHVKMFMFVNYMPWTLMFPVHWLKIIVTTISAPALGIGSHVEYWSYIYRIIKFLVTF
jgi:hypothetical protein